MTLFAKLITPATIDEITEINDGVRPAEETLNDNTFYVYPDKHTDDYALILDRSVFEKRFRWLDVNSIDNIVVKR